MIERSLLEAVLRGLGSGVAIWRLEDPAAPSHLRLLLANQAASRWAGVDLVAGVDKLIGEIDAGAVRNGRHALLARVATSGVGEAIAPPPGADPADPRSAPARALPLPGRCVAVVVEDTEARQRAEEDARRLTAFLDSIVENIPAMVFVKDAEHLRYQLFNKGAELLTGRPRKEVLGRNAQEAGVPADQASFFEEKDREVLRNGVLLDVPEEPVQTKDGQRRWLHTKKIPILEPGGKPKYLLGISLDITDSKVAAEALKSTHEELERRVAERTADLVSANEELRRQMEELQRTQAALETTESQLRQAQKMEAIGRLAGGVAHDFNNLLSVIVGCASMLAADRELGARFSEDVDEIRRAGERAAELTRHLLAFSRQQVRSPTVLNLNEVIGRLDRLLRRVIGEDIELVTVQAKGLDLIEADAGQIEQVLMNLVVNARDAMPSGGRLRVETANVQADQEFVRAHVGLAPGPHVMLAVTDNGTGIDQAIQDKIFEPFFTTKEPGKGTGLGLPTVFGIVKQSGGGIFVESQVGAGSTFRCYFPVSQAQPSATHVPPSTGVVRGTETILLVEDDDQVRRLVSRILEKNGYHVVDASTPREALRVANQRAQTLHLLITDVVMPQMNGRELADRVRTLRPDIEILYMSGYSEHLLDKNGVLEAGLHFLPKPITPAALTQAVRALLDPKKR